MYWLIEPDGGKDGFAGMAPDFSLHPSSQLLFWLLRFQAPARGGAMATATSGGKP